VGILYENKRGVVGVGIFAACQLAGTGISITSEAAQSEET
jgi:hypothetical protein